ncbi:hypothetical protein BS78_03G150900 [Paspalum vaginatum]|nr:hypothetical protein BS78_03G150900 [Paspalum vaginatum]
MASLLRWTDKYMKERLQGLSCSSAASTSIVVASYGRAIDRHSPHLRDPHRRLTPSLPKAPSSPASSASASTNKDSLASSSSSSLKQQQQLYYSHYGDGKDKRKKKATPSSAAGNGRSSTSTEAEHKMNKKKAVQLQQESPASSSRFLLNSSRMTMQSDNDTTAVEALPTLPPPRPYFIDDDDDIFPSPSDAVLPPPVVSPLGPQLVASPVELFAEPPAVVGSSSPVSSSEIRDHVAGDSTVMMRSCSTRAGQNQVVVLRVSLHCKGCAAKVKKHIAKMEGVTSFDIDIATKKVTVVGDVTPLGVLNSISKVKSAQFWTDYSLSTLSTLPRASAS